MLKVKNTITEMKNIFDGHNSRLDMTEKKKSDIENMSIETFQNRKSERKKMRENRRDYSRTMGQL